MKFKVDIIGSIRSNFQSTFKGSFKFVGFFVEKLVGFNIKLLTNLKLFLITFSFYYHGKFIFRKSIESVFLARDINIKLFDKFNQLKIIFQNLLSVVIIQKSYSLYIVQTLNFFNYSGKPTTFRYFSSFWNFEVFFPLQKFSYINANKASSQFTFVCLALHASNFLNLPH